MKKLLLINDTTVNNITYYHFLLLFVCLPLDRFFGELTFISLVIHTLIHLKKSDLDRFWNKQVLVIQAVFWVLVFSTLYMTDRTSGYNELAPLLPLLLLPMLFALHQPLVNKYKKALLTGFSLCCVLVVLYMFGVVISTLLYFQKPITSLFSLSFINHNFSAPVNIHATFFSMLLVTAVVIFFENLISETSNYRRALYIFGIAVLFAGLVQLCSKSAIISLLIVVNFFVPFVLSRGRKRLAIFTLLVVCTLAGVITLYRSDSNLQKRLFTDLETDIDLNKETVVTDSRMDRWHAAIQAVKEKPLLGYGSGTESQVIHQAYFENKLYHSYIMKLNAHNQYLSILVESGVFGLIVYLSVLGYGFMVSVSKKDLLLITFFILIISISMAEDIMGNIKGVYFYAMFFSLIFFVPKKSEILPKKADYLSPMATLHPLVTC